MMDSIYSDISSSVSLIRPSPQLSVRSHVAAVLT